RTAEPKPEPPRRPALAPPPTRNDRPRLSPRVAGTALIDSGRLPDFHRQNAKTPEEGAEILGGVAVRNEKRPGSVKVGVLARGCARHCDPALRNREAER